MARNMYQLALDSQTACNLSGLIYSLPKIADEVWEELRANNNGTIPAFREHPVMRLFAEQIAFLAAGDYSAAAAICEEKKNQ